ncbi:unnamed protein product [Porites lobata]|uniref:Amine oxidase domain-containing protein n=1 Tax=Porites lobata TaxID=104759 RepID=A0ABN8QZW9_9CNID|nr:unnamed protein product [Porites lobata]
MISLVTKAYRLLPDMTCQCCHLCYYLCYYLCTCTIEFGVKLPFRNTLIPLKFPGISILAIQVNRFSVSSLVEVYSNQFSLVISSFDSHSFIYSVYRSLQPFLLFLELSLSFTTTSEGLGTDKKVKTKVLILGAGLSGITTAKTLLDNNIKDFYVLEGQDYIGGRIHAVQFEGVRVEAGANWLHSLDNEASEVLVKLMSDSKISGLWSNYSDFIIRDENGIDVTDWKVIQKFKKTVVEKLEDFQWHRKKRNMPQIPARVGLQLMGWKSDSPIEKVLEYFKIDFTHSKNPELISFYNLIGEGKDFLVSDQRGLWFMYKSLYRRVKKKVLLKKTVDSITYSGNSVVIQTKENETFVADYALCTFSTGVLASDSIAFNPPLPQWKQEAIYKNPMSVYTKIFLKFPYKFWDDNEYILYASKRRGYFPVMQNMEKEGLLPIMGPTYYW